MSRMRMIPENGTRSRNWPMPAIVARGAPDRPRTIIRGAAMDADTTRRDPSSGSSGTSLAGRTLGAIPAPALVMLGIVSVQLGSALAKHLFSAVGSFGAVALRLFFPGTVLMLLWRPSLRMGRRTWAVVITYGVIVGA